MIDRAGKIEPISKIEGFLGFLISNGASSPRPIVIKRVGSAQERSEVALPGWPLEF